MSAPRSVCALVYLAVPVPWGSGASGLTHVDLAILEALLQVVVDGFIRHLADQREIRHTDFLLLGRLEDGLLCELRGGLSLGRGLLLAPCALRHRLHNHQSSIDSGRFAAASSGCTMTDARERPHARGLRAWRGGCCCDAETAGNATQMAEYRYTGYSECGRARLCRV